ncbi:MAG: hypothetical protein K9L78_03215 [Victivallales bacterium]|nr:hypothetical protein [Victivallales bacterium]MCF7889108.1 hypothetical protein [Victivallales bacterium]
MKNLKLFAAKTFIVFAVLAAVMVPVTVLAADDLPKGVVQVWTAVEGNIRYYVKEGDKVKKGDPLFFILTSDNNSAIYFKIQSQLEYQHKLYLRRKKLIETHAVSQEAYDEAYEGVLTAEAELISYLVKVKLGFYRAPFDCEIVKLLYVQGSGIGDGNPAINIRCTDPNYKFEPPVPGGKFMQIIKLSDQWVNEKLNDFEMKKFKKLVHQN